MKRLIFLLILILAFTLCQKFETKAITIQEEQVNGDTVKAELNRAKFFIKQGNTEDASKIYVRLMESCPDNKDVVREWLMANMKRTPTGEEDAIKQLEELGKLAPENTAIVFWKSFIQAEYGHGEEALKGFDKLTSLQPDSAVNWVGKGQVLESMNRHEDAFKAFDVATSLDPERFDVWGMKGGALGKMGKYDEAISTLNKALELSPDYAVNIYNRGCIYCLKGDKVNALTDLKRAISLNPEFKVYAPKDEDFKSLWDDEDFKKLTL